MKKPTSGSVTRAAEGNSHSKVRLIRRTSERNDWRGEGLAADTNEVLTTGDKLDDVLRDVPLPLCTQAYI